MLIVKIPHKTFVWFLLVCLMFLAGFWLATRVNVTSGAPLRAVLAGPPPAVVSYQGIVDVAGEPFSGTGYFKFALVDSGSGDGTLNYWANDGQATGEPTNAVSIDVDNSLFNVLLGDTSLMNMMTPLDETAVSETDTYLRVWFSDSPTGPFAALEPNQRLTSAPYALHARQADEAPSSIVAHSFRTGLGNTPASERKFLALPATVTVAEGENIFVVSTKSLGTTTGANGLDLYICYRVDGVTNTPPSTVGGGALNMRLNATQRVPMTLSAILTGLAPGIYDVGLCGDDDGNGNWNSNEYSYTTALVFKSDDVNFVTSETIERDDNE